MTSRIPAYLDSINRCDDFCQTPVKSPDFSLGLGVDFVLPLSQQQQQQQQQQQEPPTKIYRKDLKYKCEIWHISSLD